MCSGVWALILGSIAAWILQSVSNQFHFTIASIITQLIVSLVACLIGVCMLDDKYDSDRPNTVRLPSGAFSYDFVDVDNSSDVSKGMFLGIWVVCCIMALALTLLALLLVEDLHK